MQHIVKDLMSPDVVTVWTPMGPNGLPLGCRSALSLTAHPGDPGITTAQEVATCSERSCSRWTARSTLSGP